MNTITNHTKHTKPNKETLKKVADELYQGFSVMSFTEYFKDKTKGKE